MSHIAHMRNKFKSMNTFEQSYIDYKDTIISFFVWSLFVKPWIPIHPKKDCLKKGVTLHLNKFSPLHPRMLYSKFGWNWRSGFGQEDFLNFIKLEFPSPKGALYQVWLKSAQWFWRRRWKCEKFTDRWTTDNRRSEKLKWAKNQISASSHENKLSFINNSIHVFGSHHMLVRRF